MHNKSINNCEVQELQHKIIHVVFTEWHVINSWRMFSLFITDAQGNSRLAL